MVDSHIRHGTRRGAIVLGVLALLGPTTSWGDEPTDLTTETSSLFSGSGNCALCHVRSRDALVDGSGADVSPPTHWRSTMMANAARDPLWQAVVESETADHPELREAIETICTRCHAPLGQVEAIHSGAASYGLDAARGSPLAMDGVSCTLCHQIQPGNLGTDASFSAGFVVEAVREIFGPYPDPLVRHMERSVGYTPVFGEHVGRSELCATCHTLFTVYLDDDGQIAGTFPEQVPYLEWKNSIYPAENVTCQTCHMPEIDDPVKISRLPGYLAPRSPFSRHEFVGGNTFVQAMLRDNASELGVTATPEHFDATIARTREQLEARTVRLEAEAVRDANELVLRVSIENLAGHKFPTGFPSRRAWLHVRVASEDGAAIFESGDVDSLGRIRGVDPGFEPHRDVIESSGRAQIYEMVLRDVNGERTFDLLRAAGHLKDNRIPPKGFVTAVPRYDDMAVVGEAEGDPDFNRAGDSEGTGRDTVRYLVDTSTHEDDLTVEIDLLFQSVSPMFLEAVLTHEVPAVEDLRTYTSAEPNAPEVLQSITLHVEGEAEEATPFRRGDANADGTFDVSDPLFLLGFLFTGGDLPPCLESADANASGDLDLSDAVYSLLALFAGGGGLPPPFSSCGTDPSSELGCSSFPPCED